MRIIIETIPHSDQRYETCGDYFRDADGTLHIKISEMSDQRSEILVAVHELVEQFMTECAGITNEQIDDFDMGHPELEDPGADPRAPYHREHTISTDIEMQVCAAIGMSWDEHCLVVDGAGE